MSVNLLCIMMMLMTRTNDRMPPCFFSVFVQGDTSDGVQLLCRIDLSITSAHLYCFHLASRTWDTTGLFTSTGLELVAENAWAGPKVTQFTPGLMCHASARSQEG